jgi:diguanylate cyclase (GGDEF)-like protein
MPPAKRRSRPKAIVPKKTAAKIAAPRTTARAASRTARAVVSNGASILRLQAQHPPVSSTHDARVTNHAFNRFLAIGARDRALLRRYRKVLGQNARTFARVFYDYLFEHPATAQVLHAYRQGGGNIDALIGKQTGHLRRLLNAATGPGNAAVMARIGEIHLRFQIAPVWIMGAYLRYLDHLLGIVHASKKVRAADRMPLEDAIHKFVFRDMGLQLEGYWLAANRELAAERDKVTELQSQITSLLANLPQLIWSVDVANGRLLYLSPVTRTICDMDAGLPIPCLGWTVPEDRARVQSAWETALSGSPAVVETRVQDPDGTLRWFRRMFYPYRDPRGRVVRIDGLMEDVTEARELTSRLEALATTDSLTALPNRMLFQDRLSQAIAAAGRTADRQVAVMVMDLDHFKEINDTLGHQAGDRVLIEIARRLAGALREGDTLTRLGGDEFAALLPLVPDARRSADKVARKIIAALASPVHLGENELYLGASIGIALYPEHGGDGEALLARADVAMYACKNRDARYTFYDRRLDPNAPQRLRLSGELRHALERRELELFYQPKVDMASRRLSGVEALIRWRHPTRGLVTPNDFIPLAERTGLIKPITDWAIETALAQAVDWRAGGLPLRVAVNVSGRVFQDVKFAERVQAALAAAGLPAGCLEIEITENLLMSDVEHTSPTLRALVALGARIAIDDFGTGYSSLSHLKQLPLHALKIDKSFVLGMARDDNDAIIVRSIVELAHNFGREVIAEGIENEETWGLLERLGCDGAQGYHIARPMPAGELRAWIAAGRWGPPGGDCASA